MEYHITKDGTKIKLCDLELSHLENILKWIEKKAAEGFTVRSGGGSTSEDFWYDEETFYGEKVLKELDYYDYKAELVRRLKTQKDYAGLRKNKATFQINDFIKALNNPIKNPLKILVNHNRKDNITPVAFENGKQIFVIKTIEIKNDDEIVVKFFRHC